MAKKKDMRMFKKSPEELQEYLIFKHRGSFVRTKKGKGSYSRKEKYKKSLEDQICSSRIVVECTALVKRRQLSTSVRI